MGVPVTSLRWRLGAQAPVVWAVPTLPHRGLQYCGLSPTPAAWRCLSRLRRASSRVSNTAAEPRWRCVCLAIRRRPDNSNAQKAPAQVTAESSHQVQQQLETIASNLATARSLVEQLTASQKQMALDIASMETSKDNFSQRTWRLSQSAAFHSAISKSQQKIVRSSPSPVTSARPKAQITPERLHRPELSSGMRRFDSSVTCRVWLETLSHLGLREL
jgi:hypothetical protein